jgi:peptide/nickel transport system permease protein
LAAPRWWGTGWLTALSLRLGNSGYVAGAAILVPLVLIALLAPLLPLADPFKPNILASLDAPSLAHPFGTDKLGRDVLSRTLQGLRSSLLVGFAVAGLALLGGMVVGTLAGFLGKSLDTAISALIDVLLSFP